MIWNAHPHEKNSDVNKIPKYNIRIEVESELEYQQKKLKFTTLILFCIIYQYLGSGSGVETF